jgi:small conductance mechanosensitive channel
MHSLASTATDWFATFWDQWHVAIRIALILVIALVLRWVLLFSVRRVVNRVANAPVPKLGVVANLANEISPIAKARVVQRTKTMGSVLNNFITWTFVVFTVIMVLSELGVAIGALAAGAGLLGAGIGFGAQSLVKDLISGLFIVFEDQFGVGDSVNLGEISGTVEAVGLRVTQVRDVDGVLWYVRNGEILRVGNHSQGWSRAVIDVALDYKASVTEALAVIEKTAGRVVSEPHNTALVIASPEVWSVHSLSGDQVVIRLVQKTKAGASDEVARELRAQLKADLDAAGIALANTKTAIYVETKN